MPTNNDYQKYFIVDGQHVGDYEGMYRDCADPWRIEELGLRLDMKAALLLVDSLPHKPLEVLDAGAGAGLFSLELWRLLTKSRPGSKLTLSDISETALNQARRRFEDYGRESFEGRDLPEVTYRPFDLRDINDPNCPWPERGFDLIFLGQVIWGLVDNIDGLFPGLQAKLKPDGHLIMSQHFPGLSRQSYAPYLDPLMVARLAERAGFKLLRTLETDRLTNHHWAALWSCD